MHKFDVNGQELSPDIAPDVINVMFTPDDLKKWETIETPEAGAFVHRGWFYSFLITPETVRQLKDKNSVRVKAHRGPSF